MTQDLINAVVDFADYIRAKCAFRMWYLPDGSLAIFDVPMTALEAAEACDVEDWAELEPCFGACHAYA